MKCTNTNKIPTLSGVKIQFDFRGLHKSYKILCGIALAREEKSSKKKKCMVILEVTNYSSFNKS